MVAVVERFELPRLVANLPDYSKLIPPNPVHETNDLLEGVTDAVGRQSVVLAELVELAKDERAARRNGDHANERTPRARPARG
jgi:hypothetical protein